MTFPPPIASRNQAIVLVHGAWVGEWSWLPVLEDLRASRRPVHAVSLTGHGSRSHESGPEVTLSDHVADVVGLIETLDLTEVTLVGHSYGGRVITRVWVEVAARVASMVYIDAHTPVAEEPPQGPERVAMAEANGGMIPFGGYEPKPDLVGGDAGVQWFLDRVMPQSFACFTEPWQHRLPDDLAKTFVYAGAGENDRFTAYSEACRNDPNWRHEVLDGPHFLMVSHPTEVARIILDA